MSTAALELAAALSSAVVRVLLLNSLYASVVFAAVAGCLALAPGVGPRVRRALWLLVLLRLVLPPGLTHPLSVGSLIGRWSMAAGVALDASGGAAVSVPEGRPVPAGAVVVPAHVAPTWEVWLAGLWLIGAAFAVHRWQRAASHYRRLAAAAVGPPSNPALEALAERWRRRLGVRRRVRLGIVDAPTMPFTLGLLRPVIVLPRAALRRPEVLEPAVAHEMAHIARLDSLWLGVENLVRCLYFFHPLVRLTCSTLDHERELACDRHVLATGELRPRCYAGGLVEALGLGVTGAGATTLVPRERRITVRVRSILESPSGRPLPTPVLVLVVSVLALIGLPMAGGEPPSTAGPEAPDTLRPAAVEPPAPDLQLVHPLPDGRLSMPWGPGRNPFTHGDFHHDGVDLAAPRGTPIRAAADGVVVKTVVDYGDAPRGRLVMLAHDGDLITSYSHVDEVRVAQGQRVAQGEVIATVGSTGLSTGPHLHFEVRRVGEPSPLNPATLVEGM